MKKTMMEGHSGPQLEHKDHTLMLTTHLIFDDQISLTKENSEKPMSLVDTDLQIIASASKTRSLNAVPDDWQLNEEQKSAKNKSIDQPRPRVLTPKPSPKRARSAELRYEPQLTPEKEISTEKPKISRQKKFKKRGTMPSTLPELTNAKNSLTLQFKSRLKLSKFSLRTKCLTDTSDTSTVCSVKDLDVLTQQHSLTSLNSLTEIPAYTKNTSTPLKSISLQKIPPILKGCKQKVGSTPEADSTTQAFNFEVKKVKFV